MARPKFSQGYFKPKNPQKYVGDSKDVVYRSSWELRFMRWCDSNRAVKMWNSEGIVIPYFSVLDSKPHRYFVDFMIQLDRGDHTENVLIEIKPYEEMLPPKKSRSKYYESRVATWVRNQEKWKAANAWAEKNGAKFIVMNEYDLGLKKRN